MLQVITPATTNDLTVLATVKAELRVETTADDTYLDALIAQASDACARFCGRTGWGRETVRQTERIAGWRECIVLDRDLRPAVSAVSVDGVALLPAEYELDGSLLYRLRGDDRTCWTGKVVVDYQAGFGLLTDTPFDLERAAIEWIKAAWGARGRDPMLRSHSTEGVGAASFLDPRSGAESMPPQAAGFLAPWRLVTL